MKRYLILLLSALLMSMSLHAQDVWREGTRWEVECMEDESDLQTFLYLIFELKGHTVIDGVDYLNLIDVNEDCTIGYVRTERGDTVVYARLCEDGTSDEFLLYDFGTFEPDTYFHYSVWNNTDNDAIPHITTETDTITAESLTYYHDVIADGDILPCWNDVLFKVGCLDGPMAYVYNPIPESEIPTYGEKKPKRRNVSHTVLQLAGREVTLTPNGIIAIHTPYPSVCECHNLMGMRVKPLHKGIYIINGKKYLK